MTAALASIAPILLALLLGMQAHRVLPLRAPVIDRVVSVTLAALLALMGASMGALPGFMAQFARVGAQALALAAVTTGATALGLMLLLRRAAARTDAAAGAARTALPSVWHALRDALALLGWVLLGFAAAWWQWLPAWDWGAAVTGLLYLLIFAIGCKLGLSGVRLAHLLANRRGVQVALLTVLLSWLGAALAAPMLGLPRHEALALASGFGWYSLSGLLFTQMGAPLLGALGFMADVLRELIALVALPLLARAGWAAAGVGVAGATAMDVTLPLIERHLRPADATAGFVSGAVLTLVAPLLIPLWFGGRL